MVLGFLRAFDAPATPYDLKRMHAASVGHFWSIPHSQLYAEPARLAAAGLVEEERETAGRRRRLFTITPAGDAALDAWLAEPGAPPPELRDVAMIKLYFGADPAAVAAARLPCHERLLAAYTELHTQLAAVPGPRGPVRTLEAGITHERALIRFWRSLRGGSS